MLRVQEAVQLSVTPYKEDMLIAGKLYRYVGADPIYFYEDIGSLTRLSKASKVNQGQVLIYLGKTECTDQDCDLSFLAGDVIVWMCTQGHVLNKIFDGPL